MAKRNLTLQLDDETIRKAKILAAERGTSVSRLLAREVEDLVISDERYRRAWSRARAAMEGASARGPRGWSRDDLYDRWEAHGR